MGGTTVSLCTAKARDDENRVLRMLDDVVSHATEEEFGETTASPTADDDHVGWLRVGLAEQLGSRDSIADHGAMTQSALP